ncbi:SGNH hydrolase domain-containing protein [Rhizobium sp. RAF56]|uniref:SGNH hydrolase domain-containing protein n=1 Tax=Rhizobium sp. RAF56 TaxID=3233062 RepID=UPI003F9AC7B6
MAREHISLVFLAAYWTKYVHNSELPNQGIAFDPSVQPPTGDFSAAIAAGLDSTLADLRKNGVKVVLVMDVPEMGRLAPDTLARAVRDGGSTDIAPPWSYVMKRQALGRSILAEDAATYHATVVDPLPAFCHSDHCDADRNGIPLYLDSDHITATAARSLSYLYAPVFASLRADSRT